MQVSAQDVLAIGGTVTLMTQGVKYALPGDYDDFGVQICGVVSLLAVAAWILQTMTPSAGPAPVFDWLTLWAGTWISAIGVYESAKMATSTGERSVKKLRKMRDQRVDEKAA